MTRTRKWPVVLFTVAIMFLIVGTAHAWFASGQVVCDDDFDGSGLPFENVIVTIMSQTGPFIASDTTNADGNFGIVMPQDPDQYKETLDETTLPGDAIFINPPINEFLFALSESVQTNERLWLIDSAICRDGGAGCRVTGGGNDTSGIDPAGGWDKTMANAKSKQLANGGYNRYTFGGQAGARTGEQPQPTGEWTHHQQSGIGKPAWVHDCQFRGVSP